MKANPLPPLPCSSERVRSLKSYLLAAAPLAAVALTATAEAGVQVFTPDSPNSADLNSGSGYIYFNPKSNFTTSDYQGTDIGFRASGFYALSNSANIQFVSLEGSHVNLLSAGTTIGPDSTFVSGSAFEVRTESGSNIYTGSDSNAYIGFRLVDEATAGGYDYGWVSIDYNLTYVSSTITLNQWALENGGQGFTAGAVPEPATTALLGGLFVFGFVLLRHRWRAWWRSVFKS